MKIKNLKLAVVTMLLALSVVGCSSNESTIPESNSLPTEAGGQVADGTDTSTTFPITMTDSRGVAVTVAEEPMRIVSLAPNTTEILAFLGAEEKIVGRTRYCSYPESLADVPEVGGTSDPNVEAVVALEPDLVIASTHTSPEILEKLESLDIPVAFLNEQEDFQGTYDAIYKTAMLIGKQDAAEEVVAAMQASVAATKAYVEEATADGTLPKVYYMMWFGDSDSTAGGDTFIGELIRMAGAINIAEDVVGWGITKEVIAEQDPDIIILPTGTTTLETLQATPFYQDLRAIKEGNVFEVDNDMISRQGPRIVDALAALAEGIHPPVTQ